MITSVLLSMYHLVPTEFADLSIMHTEIRDELVHDQLQMI